MADVTKEQVIEFLSGMSVMDLAGLVEELEDKWGVTAAAAAPVMMMGAGAGAAAEEEKTDFDVVMTSFGQQKIKVIKAVREITGLGLKEAKEKVEAVPATIKEGLEEEEANKLKEMLEDVGATVELK